MKLRRNLKILTVAALVGAAVAYLMDPVAGRRRRDRLARMVERGRTDVAHLRASAQRIKDAVATDAGATDDATDVTSDADPPPIGGAQVGTQRGDDGTPEVLGATGLIRTDMTTHSPMEA